MPKIENGDILVDYRAICSVNKEILIVAGC